MEKTNYGRIFAKLVLASALVIASFFAVLPIKVAAIQSILPAPHNFTIDLYEEKDVILLWEAPESNIVEKFIIQRSDKEGVAPKEIARVDASETTYIDDKVEEGKSYTYRVQSYAPNFITGDSELKSVKVTRNQQQRFDENAGATADPANPAPSDSSASASAGDTNYTLVDILAFNLILIGIMLLAYMSIRELLIRRAKQRAELPVDDEEDAIDSVVAVDETITATITPSPASKAEAKSKKKSGPRLNLKYDAKVGKPDVDILAEADKRFEKDRDKKLKEWVDKTN